eukprot:9568182-Alexandrium_andersonii.AAC.1
MDQRVLSCVLSWASTPTASRYIQTDTSAAPEATTRVVRDIGESRTDLHSPPLQKTSSSDPVGNI